MLLKCNDLEQTRNFYHDVLRFDILDSAQGTLTVEKEGTRLLFTEADLWRRETGCSGTIYIGISDVDAYYGQVASQADIAWPVQETSYGSREFGLMDCNGYLLAFQQNRQGHLLKARRLRYCFPGEAIA